MSDTNPNRRSVLKQFAGGAVVAGGMSTAAAGRTSRSIDEERRQELLHEFEDPTRVRRAVDRQSEFLELLSREDVLAEPSIADLDELNDPEDGVGEHVSLHDDGESFTPRVKLFRRVDAGYLSLSIFPEHDTAHAILNPTADGEPLGEDHLQTYGSTPDPQPAGCTGSGGECKTCNCWEFCCDKVDGTCVQYCEDCSCSCYCCTCGFLCPGECV